MTAVVAADEMAEPNAMIGAARRFVERFGGASIDTLQELRRIGVPSIDTPPAPCDVYVTPQATGVIKSHFWG